MHRAQLRRLAQRWGPAALMMIVIFAASAQPKAVVPIYGEWDLLIKKSGHLLGYALLGVAYARGIADARPPTVQQLGLALLLAAVYGATDEFHQSFVAGRGATWQDVVIDAVGAAVGLCVRWVWAARASPRPRPFPASGLRGSGRGQEAGKERK